jgi:hypothetical protein
MRQVFLSQKIITSGSISPLTGALQLLCNIRGIQAKVEEILMDTAVIPTQREKAMKRIHLALRVLLELLSMQPIKIAPHNIQPLRA